MKIKTLVAMLFLSAGATTVVAQDATNCNSNSSISHEAVRAGNFKDAYTPWKAVLENCPTLRFYTFTDGYKILKGLMAQIKDRNNPEYQKYFNELMNTHDLRIKYTDEFLAKGTKVSSADEALGIKAVDYIALAPKLDVNQAYQWLSQSVNAVKGESAGATIFYFLQMSLDKLKADPAHKEQFIQDYLAASEYADAAIAAETNEAKKKALLGIKDNLVALFVNSGTADCESLQGIYGPKVEANQTDLAYLKKVIDIMKMMKCTESEAYLQASFYAYKMEPTAEAATGCAYQAFKKGHHQNIVYDTFKPKLKTTSKKVIFLTWDELNKLKDYHIPHDKQYLERIRDVFLFCCFTSLRYSDVRNLKRSDIKPDHIEVTTVKTADSLIIELNDHSKAILEKYKDVHFENHMALPVISNQKMNDYLKELGELAEINEPVRETYYKGNERIDEITPKYALLSTHAGRRTFICNALALGIPAQVVMKWTGHSDYKAMKPYIDIADDIRANAMNKFNQL